MGRLNWFGIRLFFAMAFVVIGVLITIVTGVLGTLEGSVVYEDLCITEGGGKMVGSICIYERQMPEVYEQGYELGMIIAMAGMVAAILNFALT